MYGGENLHVRRRDIVRRCFTVVVLSENVVYGGVNDHVRYLVVSGNIILWKYVIVDVSVFKDTMYKCSFFCVF